MSGSKWANFADEQSSDKKFSHFDPIFSEKEKEFNFADIGPKSAKISSAKISSLNVHKYKSYTIKQVNNYIISSG